MISAWWQGIWLDFQNDLASELPGLTQLVRILFRLIVAAILGGLLGLEREWTGKMAGLRTHMLVSLGAAVFVLTGSASGMSNDGLSRILQGVATGVGFIGGGVILKLSEERKIKGVTTAATIWMTAAVGAAAGVGRFWAAVAAVVLTLFILVVLRWIEERIEERASEPKD